MVVDTDHCKVFNGQNRTFTLQSALFMLNQDEGKNDRIFFMINCLVSLKKNKFKTLKRTKTIL